MSAPTNTKDFKPRTPSPLAGETSTPSATPAPGPTAPAELYIPGRYQSPAPGSGSPSRAPSPLALREKSSPQIREAQAAEITPASPTPKPPTPTQSPSSSPPRPRARARSNPKPTLHHAIAILRNSPSPTPEAHSPAHGPWLDPAPGQPSSSSCCASCPKSKLKSPYAPRVPSPLARVRSVDKSTQTHTILTPAALRAGVKHVRGHAEEASGSPRPLKRPTLGRGLRSPPAEDDVTMEDASDSPPASSKGEVVPGAIPMLPLPPKFSPALLKAKPLVIDATTGKPGAQPASPVTRGRGRPRAGRTGSGSATGSGGRKSDVATATRSPRAPRGLSLLVAQSRSQVRDYSLEGAKSSSPSGEVMSAGGKWLPGKGLKNTPTPKVVVAPKQAAAAGSGSSRNENFKLALTLSGKKTSASPASASLESRFGSQCCIRTPTKGDDSKSSPSSSSSCSKAAAKPAPASTPSPSTPSTPSETLPAPLRTLATQIALLSTQAQSLSTGAAANSYLPLITLWRQCVTYAGQLVEMEKELEKTVDLSVGLDRRPRLAGWIQRSREIKRLKGVVGEVVGGLMEVEGWPGKVKGDKGEKGEKKDEEMELESGDSELEEGEIDERK